MVRYSGIAVTWIDPAIAMPRFGRPRHTFLEGGLLTVLADAHEAVAASAEARVFVLAPDGTNFCAGADFSRVDDGADTAAPAVALPASSVRETYFEAARLIAAPLPLVAAVQGRPPGRLGLACTNDFRVGSPETRLAANFAQLGVHRGLGLAVLLPPIVGWQCATELLLTGRRNRGEGYRFGLLDRFVAAHELESAAVAFAEIAASARSGSARSVRRCGEDRSSASARRPSGSPRSRRG
ncbi:MAG TPA: enoyl-CoA hydratase/isomerase family protein [Dehalococcoidia bacterium]|nr:enoyl-CoA hydratase/isomerase family protein [Dehalococcoidia bacterium]